MVLEQWFTNHQGWVVKQNLYYLFYYVVSFIKCNFLLLLTAGQFFIINLSGIDLQEIIDIQNNLTCIKHFLFWKFIRSSKGRSLWRQVSRRLVHLHQVIDFSRQYFVGNKFCIICDNSCLRCDERNLKCLWSSTASILYIQCFITSESIMLK